MIKYLASICVLCLAIFSGCDPEEEAGKLELSYIRIGTLNVTITPGQPIGVLTNASVNENILVAFTAPLNPNSVTNAISFFRGFADVPFTYSLIENNSVISIDPQNALDENTLHQLTLTSAIRGSKGQKFSGEEFAFLTTASQLQITSWSINGAPVTAARVMDVPLTISIEINFSDALDPQTVANSVITMSAQNSAAPSLQYLLSNENKTLTITSADPLAPLERYTLAISSSLKGNNAEIFAGLSKSFYTAVDPTPKFPVISDDALLTLIQQQTFKYFWDFAHPTSGLARERNTSGDIVTTGGSGFGIMSIIVGIERNFITRQQGIDRLDKILDFLETADRFHGVWPHWLNGNTGKVQPFSANDNGGDLVETSFLMQGLITFRQYLNSSDATEQQLISRINTLWSAVEWNWYTQGGQNVLYWHWSPDKAWIMNHQIKGYNEALITYVLAASSTTHSINASVYHQGWASSGGIANGKTFYGTTLPLGFDYGGPLFFAHYSFLGLDPRNLSDTYGNYWTQNVNHSKINYAYSAANPKKFVGYSDESWGLTASDNHSGYSAHSPTNDLGVITPTAALSSFPYTPTESMKALKFFYYTIGDRLWGQYGFYDAYNFTEGWVASSYLAIDQGPIIVMIENHRTGLLWDLFMSAPEVQAGLDKLSFTY